MSSPSMSTMVRTAKKAMREEVKKLLVLTSPEKRALESQLILQKVLKHDRFKSSARVSVYLSAELEVDTILLLGHIFTSGKACFVPKYEAKSRHMDMVRLESMADYESLPVTPWRLKQPADDEVREEALTGGGLDLMIVPGVAFTKSGQRLGKGRGYYDSYLERCLRDSRIRPYTIGLAFSQQIVDTLPMDANDVKLDEVIYAEDRAQ